MATNGQRILKKFRETFNNINELSTEYPRCLRI